MQSLFIFIVFPAARLYDQRAGLNRPAPDKSITVCRIASRRIFAAVLAGVLTCVLARVFACIPACILACIFAVVASIVVCLVGICFVVLI